MKTVIVTGGNIEYDFALDCLYEQNMLDENWRQAAAGKKTKEQVLRHSNMFDCVIAADKGLEFLDQAGICPDYIVGDFDSGKRQLVEKYRALGVTVREYNPVKDATDTEIAMKLAIEMGSTDITVLGAIGTRMDHVLGSIRNLSIAMKHGINACILDSHNRIRMMNRSFVIYQQEQYGKYVSLFAHKGPVTGLTLKGFFYPLTNYTMMADDAIGVSNEIVADKAEVDFEEGCLLVVESKD